MPKNLDCYLNYVYKKPKKHNKINIKIFLIITVIILTYIFNNLGYLDVIIQKKYIVFHENNFYLLVLNEETEQFTTNNLSALGCATLQTQDGIILNIYKSELTCEKIKNNLLKNNLNCFIKELCLKNIYTPKTIANSTKNLIEECFNTFLNNLTTLLDFCESYDKNLINYTNIMASINSMKNKNLEIINKLTSMAPSNITSKIILFFKSADDCFNLLSSEFEHKSHLLKQITVNYLLNFYNIFY